MRTTIRTLLTGVMIAAFCAPAFADGDAIQLSGSLYNDNRARMQRGTDTNEWHEYRADLTVQKKQGDAGAFFAEAWLWTLGYPSFATLNDAISKDRIAPWTLELREAYFDVYNFVAPRLDLRVGRQRMAWGRGDKINPTDNVNPNDLTDIWDFGRHLGSDGVKATYYAGEYAFTGAFFPDFRAATLPAGDWAQVFFPSPVLPAGLQLYRSDTDFVTPGNTMGSAGTMAFKAARKFFGYDFSVSYVNGRDDLPVANYVKLTPIGGGLIAADSRAVYAQRQIIGFDAAGSIGDVGVWAEAAQFLPEEVYKTTDLTALGQGVTTTAALEKEGYVKYLVGADYTFTNDMYLNFQYLHGFLNERREDALQDYVLGYVDWKLMNDKLTLTPVGIALNVKKISEASDNYSYAYLPKIEYSLADNAELTLGYRAFDGKGDTTLAPMKGKDELYFTAKFSF